MIKASFVTIISDHRSKARTYLHLEDIINMQIIIIRVFA